MKAGIEMILSDETLVQGSLGDWNEVCGASVR